jgi:hypothetical protein
MKPLNAIRHPLSTLNRRILSIGNYSNQYNPNQTTAVGTTVTLLGTSIYVA